VSPVVWAATPASLLAPRAVAEFIEHYHRERNHQGLGNALIVGGTLNGTAGRVYRRPRLGGLLNFYERAA